MTEGDTAKRALAQAEVGTDRLHRILEQAAHAGAGGRSRVL